MLAQITNASDEGRAGWLRCFLPTHKTEIAQNWRRTAGTRVILTIKSLNQSQMIQTLWQEHCYSHDNSARERHFAAWDSETQRVCCHFTGPGGDIEIFIALLIHNTASMGRPCSNAPIKFISADFSPDYHKTPADTHDCPHLIPWDHF